MTERPLREQIAEALTHEHYRRAKARIEATPEEHCAAMARAVLPIVADLQKRAEIAEWERDKARDERDELWDQIHRDQHAAMAERERAEQAEQARDRHAHARDEARTETAYWRKRAEQAEAILNQPKDTP